MNIHREFSSPAPVDRPRPRHPPVGEAYTSLSDSLLKSWNTNPVWCAVLFSGPINPLAERYGQEPKSLFRMKEASFKCCFQPMAALINVFGRDESVLSVHLPVSEVAYISQVSGRVSNCCIGDETPWDCRDVLHQMGNTPRICYEI